MAELKEGKKAPAFTVKNQDDEKVKLADIMGKKGLVLYFYPKDSTPGCTTEACDFRDLKKDFNKVGWTIYGVSKDSTASHRKFIEKQGLNFPLLSDEDGKMLEKYGVWQLKKFMGKEFMGIVRTTLLITADGKIAKIYPKVRVKEHAAKVLEDIKTLGK